MQLLNESPAAEPGFSQPLNITFEDRGDRLIGLGAINGLLRIITLGMYSFWAKTNVRKRLWSFTRLNGEPLEYTGTGKEIFLGFLLVFGVLFLPSALGGLAAFIVFGKDSFALIVYYILAYGAFYLLIGYGTFRAQRYRLSRTRWRGIRGALTGSPWTYTWTYFLPVAIPAGLALGAAFATANPISPEVLQISGSAAVGLALTSSRASMTILTIGATVIALILPWRANRLQKIMTSGIHFGNARLTYTGTAQPLYKNYVIAALLGVFLFIACILVAVSRLSVLATLVLLIGISIIFSWYRSNQFNHFARNTHLGDAAFEAATTGNGLAWLAISNWLIVTLSLAAGYALGFGALFASGLVSDVKEVAQVLSQTPVLGAVVVIPPVVLMVTIGTTFAQFRSTRYFMSRLKLAGTVNLASIMQSDQDGPKRGEGLAQMFDLDAF